MGKETRDGDRDFPPIRPTPNHFEESGADSDEAAEGAEHPDGEQAEGVEES